MIAAVSANDVIFVFFFSISVLKLIALVTADVVVLIDTLHAFV